MCVQIKIFKKIFIFVLLIITFKPLFGDGGFFILDAERVGNSAESPNQRALIIHNGDEETLILQVKYSGDVEKFAWIVPLPNLPEKNTITTISDTIFKKLHDKTQPTIYRIYNQSKGRNYGDGNGEGNIELIPETEVQVWQRLQVGPYEVVVLSGTSSQSLINWLTNNDYNFPSDAHDIIDFYVQKNWYFIATHVQLTSEITEKNSTYQAGLPALKMAFQTEKPVFPLRISEISSAPENEIELYVAANHRMVCETYQTVEMDRDEVQTSIEKQIIINNVHSSTGIGCTCRQLTESGGDKTEYDYEAIFRDKIALFSKPTFVVEYASQMFTAHDPVAHPEWGSFNGYFNDYFSSNKIFWLTRLRTVLSPGNMQEDVTFKPDPNGDKRFFLQIYIEDYISHSWSTAFFNLPGILLAPFLLFKKVKKRKLLIIITTITIATL